MQRAGATFAQTSRRCRPAKARRPTLKSHRIMRIEPPATELPSTATDRSARSIGGELEIDDALLEPGPDHRGPHFASGRGALHAILGEIRASREGDGVLLPDYLCESVVTTVLRAGFSYDFYAVSADLTPDVDSLVAAYREGPGPCAVLLIDYFGITDLTSTIATLRTSCPSAAIIIDGVQAPLHSDVLRSADYAFTSLRKALPVPDGALALSQAGPLTPRGSTEAAFVAGKLSGLLLKAHAAQDGIPDATFLRFLETAERQLDEVGYYDSPMSNTARRIAGHIDFGEIAAIRRTNAIHLRERLTEFGVSPLTDITSDGVPLFLPISIPRRDLVRAALADSRIYCPVHWPVPVLDGGESRFAGQALYSTELSLVIDQRYGAREMDRLADTLRQAMGR